MKLAILTLLALPAFGVAASPFQAPFADLTYPQALERACAEGRMLLLAFETDRSLQRKSADPVWSDPRVAEWIERKAVALRLGLERDATLAARLAVRFPGTVVFVDGEGREYGRTALHRGATTFLQEALFHCSRGAPLARVQPTFTGDRDDPTDRQRHGDALRDAGFLEEALTEYLWCWDEGHIRSLAYIGVHGSFLVSDLRELAQVLPAAREAMDSRRVALSERVLDANASEADAGRVAMDLVALDERFFEEPSRSVADLEAVVARGDELAFVRRFLGVQLRAALLAERRYDLLLATNSDPVAGLERLAQRLERRRERRELRPDEIGNAVSAGTLWLEACAGAGRTADALAIAESVLRVDAGPTTWAELIHACARAHAFELGRGFVGRARRELTPDQLPAVEGAASYLR